MKPPRLGIHFATHKDWQTANSIAFSIRLAEFKEHRILTYNIKNHKYIIQKNKAKFIIIKFNF